MATTDVLRPVSVRENGGGVSVPSGTLAAVTSDNSDSTYIQFTEADLGDNWNLRVEPHTPAAGYERHRIRGRIRIRSDAGTCTEDIDLGRGTSDWIAFDTVPVTDSFAEQIGAWHQDSGYGLDTAGALSDLNIGGGWIDETEGGATENRTAECYVDIDCRLSPQFAPEVRDAAGTDQSGGTVTDTPSPTLFIGAVDYDGLPATGWAVAIRDATDEIFRSDGGGQPPVSVDVTTSLPDGAYTAFFFVTSAIRGGDAFTNGQVISFSIQNTVPPPSPPLVSVTEEAGGYRVSWTNPGGQMWDNDYVVAEVYRDDCMGSQRIATVADGLNGSYLDLAIPQLDPQPVSGPDCELSTPACDITYRVRYWGYVSTSVELPDEIPSDLILGWPSTAGTIPSGWSRVTSLDGVYPLGATGTGAPSATGGFTSHSHHTPAHFHTISAHNHAVGGVTGSSNSSTTSARFNGASQPQASQPHNHTRPSFTGTEGAHTSGGENPDVSVVSNIPLTRDVIWISSDGAQTAYPIGVLGWSTESVSGWANDATSSGRYLKGAAAAGNGGATSGAATHTHTVNSHSHTGFAHDHSLGNTSLSNPSSSVEAGSGSSTPRWLPRHTHPMDVGSNSSANLNANSGGATGSNTTEPSNRRLQVLRNTGGGIQTRIIGLYTGTVASLDPLLTLCNGSGGTPDMRSYFCRDKGSDSINSTGGSSSHTHTTTTHGHTMPGHAHTTNVLTSATGSFEAPTSGDLGDSPTTGHDHTSANAGVTTPGVSISTSGTTDSISHIPPYKEVHFVRLDGTIGGGPLPVPELKVSDFSSATVPGFTYSDGLDRLASFTEKMAVATDRTGTFPKLVVDSTPLDGGLHTVSSTTAGRDLALTIAVQGMLAIDALEALLRSDRLYWSPLGGSPGWFAPAGWTVQPGAPDVKVLQVTMVHQDWPSTPEPGEFL